MKVIIDGLRYDTDAPRTKLLGSASHLGPGDFSHWRAELYRTGGRRFFLYGTGGPMTRFAQPSGSNSWTGGERIIPLPEIEARQWAEQHLDPEVVEEHFEVKDA